MERCETYQNRLEELLLTYGYNVNVKKIGGTAIEEMDTVLDDLLESRRFGQQRVAVSAIRSPKKEYESCKYEGVIQSKTGFNTTSHLKYIADTIRDGKVEKAVDIVEKSIVPFTKALVEKNVSDEETRNHIVTIIDQRWGEYVDFLNTCVDGEVLECGDDWLWKDREGRVVSFLKVGEDISAEIVHTVLESQGASAHRLVLDTEKEEQVNSYDMEQVAQKLKLRMKVAREVESGLWASMQEGEDAEIIIASGYLPGIATQEGYTDTTAAMLLRMASREKGRKPVLHRHMNYGFMSADPSTVPNAQYLEEISGRLLFEMTAEKGPQSPVLIPDAAQIVDSSKADALIYSPTNLDEVSHMRRDAEFPVGQVRAVAILEAKSIIDVEADLDVMRPEGIVNAIAVACKKNGVAIEHSPTAARAISVSLDRVVSEKEAEQIKNDIQDEMGYPNSLQVDVTSGEAEGMYVLYCKGDNMKQPGIGFQVEYALQKMGIDTVMKTQSKGENSMVHFVKTDVPDHVLREVHRCAVEHSPRNFVKDVVVADYLEKTNQVLSDKVGA